MKIHHVLLTGGVGSRLWPLSRRSRPKQYLNLFSNSSLFELAVKRNRPFTDHLIVVGNTGNQELSVENLKKLGINDFTNIIEALPRNTAPAIAFAAFSALPNDILLVTPADHIICDDTDYDDAINRAVGLANQGHIVTFGIQPTKPETGYGYIEHNHEDVLSFREKPELEKAKKYLKSGDFLWNSGMFCFRASSFLAELENLAPEVFLKSYQAWAKSEGGNLDVKTSLEIPSISVDHAVMEKSNKIKVVPSHFNWSDLGSFEAVYDYLKSKGHKVDEDGNMVIGSNKFTGFVGMRNSILVISDDAHLVLAKEESQGVKRIYESLERANSPLLQ